MRFLFTLFVFLYVSISFGQIYEFKSCLEAKNKAIFDAENGNLSVRVYGLPDRDDQKLAHFYDTYLKSKFNVDVLLMGCITPEEGLCYARMMDSLLVRKFGNAYHNSRKEAERLFENATEKEKSSILNNSRIYNKNLESHPVYIGNSKIIRDLLKKKIKENKQEVNLETIEIYYIDAPISLIIDKTGIICEIVIRPDLQKSMVFNREELLLELNNLGPWVPGYIYNTPVKSQWKLYNYYFY